MLEKRGIQTLSPVSVYTKRTQVWGEKTKGKVVEPATLLDSLTWDPATGHTSHTYSWVVWQPD